MVLTVWNAAPSRCGALAGSPLVQAGSEDEFRKLEATLLASKTLQMRFTVQIEGAQQGTFEGSLLVAEGNRVQLRAKGKFGNQEDQIHFVANGKAVKEAKGGDIQEGTTHPKLTENVITSLTRPGLFLGSFGTGPPETLELSRIFKPIGFKPARNERLGNVDYLVLSFAIEGKDMLIEMTNTTWMTPSKGLAKRVVEAKTADRAMKITESYSDWRINEPIDKAEFSIDQVKK
jgi:hypothetical protein